MSIVNQLQEQIDQLIQDTQALNIEADAEQIANNENCIKELKDDLIRLQKLIDGHLRATKP